MNALFSLGLSLLASVAFAQDLRTLDHQGISRSFLIHNSQAAKSGPKPTVIALHGFRDPGQAMTAEGQLDRIAWRKLDEVASQEDFITIYPGAINGRWNYTGTSAPVRAGAGIADDIGFISKVIDQLRLEKISDGRRIYLFGFSRGAFMTFEMLCRAADYFAAAATMAGSMLEAQRDACRPVRAVPLAVFAGTDDLNVPYDGWVCQTGVCCPFRRRSNSGGNSTIARNKALGFCRSKSLREAGFDS